VIIFEVYVYGVFAIPSKSNAIVTIEMNAAAFGFAMQWVKLEPW